VVVVVIVMCLWLCVGYDVSGVIGWFCVVFGGWWLIRSCVARFMRVSHRFLHVHLLQFHHI